MANESLVGMLVAVGLPIALSFAVAFWAIYWSHRKKQLQYEERRLMIEKGMTPPPDEQVHGHPPLTPADHLRKGIIMVFLGIGLGVAFLVLASPIYRGDGPSPWVAGVAAAIVGLLGLGHLVFYAVIRNQPPT